MSTFDGIVTEFPGIRVDFFRGIVDNPPLAGFLSHIHSDHLAGLDTYKGRPVYCSAATRAMLLKLQRRASRINFHQGYLEKEEITYKHQENRLKPLPLETPTEIELEAGNTIQVTLFDANHCPGAVMFLFEGHGKAVLYTGDIRSEPWHVNNFARSPCMVEYICGIKTLDKVYLDTSFTEDVVFQTKAEGLRELIEKVSKYPKDTTFYFSAWTYGYEAVWIALAKALNTLIHVDDYKRNVYEALKVKVDENYLHLSPEAPALTGFTRGNGYQEGLLTGTQTARLHSCEKGTRCSTMAQGNVVFITPVVTHLSSISDMAEVGIGGGADDLEQTKDEVTLNPDDARALIERESKTLSQEAKDSLAKYLHSAVAADRPISITIPDGKEEHKNDPTGMKRVVKSLTDASVRGRGTEKAGPTANVASTENVASLPNRIKFPYSRHSSYRELCHLMQVLKPKDIWPCTVDSVRWIKQGITIEMLFGEYCAGNTFSHDEYMTQLATTIDMEASQQLQSQTSVESAAEDERRGMDVHDFENAERIPLSDLLDSSQTHALLLPDPMPEGSSQRRHPVSTDNSQLLKSSQANSSLPPSPMPQGSSQRRNPVFGDNSQLLESSQATASLPPSPTLDGSSQRRIPVSGHYVIDLTHDSDDIEVSPLQRRSSSPNKRTYEEFSEREEGLGDEDQISEIMTNEDDTSHLVDSQESAVSSWRLETRRNAFNAVLGVAPDQYAWNGLLSTTNNHTRPESELGEG